MDTLRSLGALQSGSTIETGKVQPQVQAALSKPDRPDMREYGASGTPIFGGFLRERGEYNPDLVGMAAISTYEQMRRSDAQVAATLMAIKFPIRGAEWNVKIPDNASKVEKEAAEFVKEVFFEDLDFGEILRNALLMMDFGVSVHENVWEVVGNRVRLAKLAPRLPLTYYRWLTDDTGEELAALEQMGYRGSEFIVTQIPVNKMDRFSLNQEGQNYTGLSLLRPMYQHWYIKSNLYKVDAISCERNGMGVPVVSMGPEVKKEDRDAAMSWVQQLTTHERTGLVLPHEWTFKLEGVTGTLRDPKESIAHHNTMISMAGLSMFLELGQSAKGSHSLGATMADFFFMSLESTAEQVSRVMNLGTVKRLVDYNFEGVKNYPRLVCQELLTLKFENIVEALNKLAQFGVVEPDDDLESWMREKMGAPEIDKTTTRTSVAAGTPGGDPLNPTPPPAAPGKKRGSNTKAADGDQPTGAAAQAGDAGIDPTSTQVTPSPQQIQAAAQIIKQAMSDPAIARLVDAGSLHVDTSMGNGVQLRRPPRGAEKHLSLSAIVSTLDKGRDDVAAALRAARPRIQAEIVHKLVDSPVRNMHRVSIAPDDKLIAQIEAILQNISDFGARQVTEEATRQRAGRAPQTAARIRMADSKRDPLGLYADGVVGEFTNNLQQRAANVALDQQRQGGKSKGELITDIGEDLDDQSDKWIDSVASKGANEAFADGREDGYDQHKDEIGSVIYSAILDINTCPQCADADGQEGDTPDDIPDVPNPDCDGGDKCRCVHVFVFNDEEASAK